jgi:hypothetical protein
VNAVDATGTQSEDLEASVRVLKHKLWWNNELNAPSDETGLRDEYIDRSTLTVEQLARAIVNHYEGGVSAEETARSILPITVEQWKIAESSYFNQRVATSTGNMSQKQWNWTLKGPNLDFMRENIGGALASAVTLWATEDVRFADAAGQAGAGLFGAYLAVGGIRSRGGRPPGAPRPAANRQRDPNAVRSPTIGGVNLTPRQRQAQGENQPQQFDVLIHRWRNEDTSQFPYHFTIEILSPSGAIHVHQLVGEATGTSARRTSLAQIASRSDVGKTYLDTVGLRATTAGQGIEAARSTMREFPELGRFHDITNCCTYWVWNFARESGVENVPQQPQGARLWLYQQFGIEGEMPRPR